VSKLHLKTLRERTRIKLIWTEKRFKRVKEETPKNFSLETDLKSNIQVYLELHVQAV
jgi:transcriptional regulatory protein LevR